MPTSSRFNRLNFVHFCDFVVGKGRNLARIPLRVFLHQIGDHIDQICATSLHELPKKVHFGLEHWKCALRLHWRNPQRPSNVHHRLQQWWIKILTLIFQKNFNKTQFFRWLGIDFRRSDKVRLGTLFGSLRRVLHSATLCHLQVKNIEIYSKFFIYFKKKWF